MPITLVFRPIHLKVTTSFGNRREPRLPHDAAGIDSSYKCLVLDNMRVSIGFSASILFLDGYFSVFAVIFADTMVNY